MGAFKNFLVVTDRGMDVFQWERFTDSQEEGMMVFHALESLRKWGSAADDVMTNMLETMLKKGWDLVSLVFTDKYLTAVFKRV